MKLAESLLSEKSLLTNGSHRHFISNFILKTKNLAKEHRVVIKTDMDDLEKAILNSIEQDARSPLMKYVYLVDGTLQIRDDFNSFRRRYADALVDLGKTLKRMKVPRYELVISALGNIEVESK